MRSAIDQRARLVARSVAREKDGGRQQMLISSLIDLLKRSTRLSEARMRDE